MGLRTEQARAGRFDTALYIFSAVSGATYFDTPLYYGFSILKQGFDETRWCWLIATRKAS